VFALARQMLQVPGSASEQEAVQVEVTRLLVESYFDIVRKNLQDAVPKAIMRFLVNYAQRGLQQHLIRMLYRLSYLASRTGNLDPT
jgi:dynamin 1-like protein